MHDKFFESVFAHIPATGLWVEYTVKFSMGPKSAKPVKFSAQMAWCSERHLYGGGVALSGSFSSFSSAFIELACMVDELGGKVVRSNKELLEYLSTNFQYPAKRHPYLLGKAVI